MTICGRRILLVSGDAALARALGEHLSHAGFAVTVAEPATAEAAAADLVVVDGGDGDPASALCRRLKDQAEAPLVALGAGPIAGADAVVAKPVRLAVLVARIEELLARRSRFVIGPWRFDAAARLLEDRGGRRVRLTDKEVAILRLLRQTGGVVTRDQLLAEVWGHIATLATHTLETHIYRLRRKIGSSLLVTEPGGYRLAE